MIAPIEGFSSPHSKNEQHFDEAEFVALTFAVMEINSWNRLAITARPVVGGYVSPHTAVRVTA